MIQCLMLRLLEGFEETEGEQSDTYGTYEYHSARQGLPYP